MEKNNMKNKGSIIAIVGTIFLALIVLFVIVATKKEVTSVRDAQEIQMNQNDLPTKGEIEKDAATEDEIVFEDPGNDEVGTEIKELDSLINDTMPNEYSGGDLSEESIGGEVELQ